MTGGRVPHFVIIGAMKSATSSLYWWLARQPEVFLAFPKETDFFSADARWKRGRSWYSSLFGEASEGQLLGEASVGYTSPSSGAVAARRMAQTIPGARLIYVVRHPVERLRSHYRHEVQRGRESRPLLRAVEEAGNAYVGNSLYFRCLQPYAEAFPREQILVVRFEDLVAPPHAAWHAVLRHLGLPDRPAPGTVHNRTGDLAQWTPALRWLKARGFLRFPQIGRLPAPVRRAGRRLLMRGGPEFDRKLEASRADIPEAVIAAVWEDAARLEAWLGSGEPLWARTVAAAAERGGR